MTQTLDMTEGRLLGKLLRFNLPVLLTALLQTLYNAADMVVVGRFAQNGSLAMGAVGSCGALINLMVELFMGLSAGVGVCIGQSIGAGERHKTGGYLHTAIVTAGGCGIFLAALGFFASQSFLRLMNTPETLLADATRYMRAYFMGMPAALLYNFLAAALRAEGDSDRPLVFLLVSGGINVLLNVIAVCVFGLGAMGVGLATSLSQAAAAGMILRYLLRKEQGITLKGSRFHPAAAAFWEILRIGVPSGLQSVIFSFSNVLIQSTVNRFDGGSGFLVSGNSAGCSLEGIVHTCMNSFYHTAMTFTAQNMGAKKLRRIRRIAVLCSLLVFGVGELLSFVVLVLRQPLISLYIGTDAAETLQTVQAVKQAAFTRMYFILPLYGLCGCMDVLCGVLRGMGKPNLPLVTSVIGSCVFRITWIYTVCAHTDDIRLLYIAYPLSWLITDIAQIFCIIRVYRKFLRELSPATHTTL